MKNATLRVGDGSLLPAANLVNGKNGDTPSSVRASKQSTVRAVRCPVPPPPLPPGLCQPADADPRDLPPGDPSLDMIMAQFVLADLIEDARELPFDQSLAQFDGIAGLLTGNADLRACREALLKIKDAVRVLDQLRAQVHQMRQ